MLLDAAFSKHPLRGSRYIGVITLLAIVKCLRSFSVYTSFDLLLNLPISLFVLFVFGASSLVFFRGSPTLEGVFTKNSCTYFRRSFDVVVDNGCRLWMCDAVKFCILVSCTQKLWPSKVNPTNSICNNQGLFFYQIILILRG